MRQVMLDFLFRFSVLLLIIAGIYFLFMSINVPLSLEKPQGVPESARFAAYPTIIFAVVAWFSFLILVPFRQTLLVGFILGQGSLYLIAPEYHLMQYKVPYYVLIAGNGIYVLLLYFMFNYEKWKSGSLEGAAEEYESINE